jgi:hypothetical protein
MSSKVDAILERRLAALEAAIAGIDGGGFERRVAALEVTVAGIGHNGGPPLDEEPLDPPPPPKRKPVLLPDRLVAERYDVTVRTLERWDEKTELGFPKPVYVRRRRFRVIDKLDEWDRGNARKAVDSHNPRRALAQALPRAQRGRFTKPHTPET